MLFVTSILIGCLNLHASIPRLMPSEKRRKRRRKLFKDIFNHLIKKHNAETFKIKKLKFCEKEGVLGYTTVNYKFKSLDNILAMSYYVYHIQCLMVANTRSLVPLTRR
jgi:hypothetical protein